MCTNNGEANARVGAGVFVGGNQALNKSLRLPETLEQSNQTEEAVATLMAVRLPGDFTRVRHITDSKTVMDSLTKWHRRHEDTGYILHRNAQITKAIMAQLRMRKAHSVYKWVRGHDGHPGNEAANRLAAEGAEKNDNDEVLLAIPSEYTLSGAKLNCITQKLAYRVIRARKDAKTKARPRAVASLDMIVSGLQD